MKRMLVAGLLCLSLVAVAHETEAGVITKDPDQGAFWNPLTPNGGTYVYANSFVADANGTVSDLGMWLLDFDGGTDIRFEVYGSVGGNAANGPDTTNVLSTSGTLTGLGDGSLSFYSATALAGGASLVAGNTYWFAGNVIGESGTGYFHAGGHTQNSVYADNGTFWFSNDPTGINFDGQSLTPEMAFSVTIGSAAVVPEPSTFALLGIGGLALVGYGVRRKRQQAA